MTNETETTEVEAKPALPKTKARISKRGIIENIVLRQESDAAGGLAFNHLQDIILKSIESMMALSPTASVKFLENIKNEILPQAEEAATNYNNAIKEAFDSLDVEVMEDEAFVEFCKEKEAEKEEVEAAPAEAEGTSKPKIEVVKTEWEE